MQGILLFASLFVAFDASAAAVDNPGNFTITPVDTGTLFVFPAGGYQNTSSSGSINIDLIGAGTIDSSTGTATYLPTKTGATIGAHDLLAQFVVNQVSGTIDAGHGTVNIALRGRVKFTGTGFSGTCQTPVFTASTSLWGSAVPGPFTMGVESDINAFTTRNTSVLILPIATGSTCTQTAAINTALGLDGTAKSTVYLYKATVDRDIDGSF